MSEHHMSELARRYHSLPRMPGAWRSREAKRDVTTTTTPPRSGTYTPSPQEIAAACEAIREARGAGTPRGHAHASPPVVIPGTARGRVVRWSGRIAI